MQETVVTRYVVIKAKILVRPTNDLDEQETAEYILSQMNYNLIYDDVEGTIVETEVFGSTDAEPIIIGL